MRTAVVHEWVLVRAGSERVFERQARVLSDADLFVAAHDASVQLDLPSVPTAAVKSPWIAEKRHLSLPLIAASMHRLGSKQDPYDLVLTSSHSVARYFALGNRPNKHLCYVHAPMRYAWTPEIDARKQNPMVAASRPLGRWLDRRSIAGERTDYAANSTAVALRLQTFYDVDSRVIHPPVEAFEPHPERAIDEQYAISAGRLVGYKVHDLAMRAAAKADVTLVVAGAGPEESNLRRLASELDARVHFVEERDDRRFAALLRDAEVLINLANEDFGIVTAEAMQLGTPAIAFNEGGSVDIVASDGDGLLLDSRDPNVVAGVLKDAIEGRSGLSSEGARRSGERFSVARHDQALAAWVREEADLG